MSLRRNDQDNTFLAKIVFVGDSGVGKTSLLTREATDSFTEQHLATIGVDFRIKTYDLGVVQVKAQLWDTAGQERFRSIQKPYYKGAHAVCICFSLNDRKSFQNLGSHWIKEIESLQVPKQNMILIGCKSDLQNIVPTDQIILFAQQNGLSYFQTSAKENEGVSDAFRSIAIKCAQRQIANLKRNSYIQNPEKNNLGKIQKNAPKKTCC